MLSDRIKKITEILLDNLRPLANVIFSLSHEKINKRRRHLFLLHLHFHWTAPWDRRELQSQEPWLFTDTTNHGVLVSRRNLFRCRMSKWHSLTHTHPRTILREEENTFTIVTFERNVSFWNQSLPFSQKKVSSDLSFYALCHLNNIFSFIILIKVLMVLTVTQWGMKLCNVSPCLTWISHARKHFLHERGGLETGAHTLQQNMSE